MTRDFDAEILDAKTKLKKMVKDLDVIQREFITACCDFLRPWFEEQVFKHVKKNPKLTKAHGKQNLSSLKEATKKHQEKTIEIVTKYVNQHNLWWHKMQPGVTSEVGDLHKAIRFAAGSIATLLEKYKYLDPNALYPWRERPITTALNASDLKPYYPIGFEWSEGMMSQIKRYNELQSEALNLQLALQEIKSDKSANEAEDLWNSA